jgi:hypothetical protein
MKERIIVAGDIHADWGLFNTFLNKKRPSIVLQAGDFGFWPRIKKYDITALKPHNTKIYWCDGNHDDHWSLKTLTSNEIIPNVFYQKRGSVLTLPDGRNVLFFGGAHSVDRDRRTLGFDWFPEEIPSYKEFENLKSLNKKIDIVVSHTCPDEFPVERHPLILRGIFTGKVNDPTRKLLSAILEMFKPSLWYFGHWHVIMNGNWNGCHWHTLNMCADPGYWTDLED